VSAVDSRFHQDVSIRRVLRLVMSYIRIRPMAPVSPSCRPTNCWVRLRGLISMRQRWNRSPRSNPLTLLDNPAWPRYPGHRVRLGGRRRRTRDIHPPSPTSPPGRTPPTAPTCPSCSPNGDEFRHAYPPACPGPAIAPSSSAGVVPPRAAIARSASVMAGECASMSG